jgi:DNA topoisomerase-1
MNGRYGPYVKHNKINATIPKDEEPDSVTLERALELIVARAAKAGAGKKKAKKS